MVLIFEIPKIIEDTLLIVVCIYLNLIVPPKAFGTYALYMTKEN